MSVTSPRRIPFLTEQLRLARAAPPVARGGGCYLDQAPVPPPAPARGGSGESWVPIESQRLQDGGDVSFENLSYQLSTVVSWTTVAMTGNGVLGHDTGEGA